MKVACIIVNYNEYEDTMNYVKILNRYDVINRIVVVDNGSTNPDVLPKLQTLSNDKVVVLETNNNGGYNYGNNYGIKYLESKHEKYDYYIISNPDIEVSEDAIKHCLGVLEKNPTYGIAAPRMLDRNSKPIRRSAWKTRTFILDVIHATRLLEAIFYPILREGEYSKDDFAKDTMVCDCVSGSFFIMKSSLVQEIGHFDDLVFLFYEEDILSKKMNDAGYKTVCLNNEHFIHYESTTIGKSMNYLKKMKMLFNSKMYYQKEYNHINVIQELVYYVLGVCRCIELIIEIPIRKLLKK